MVRWGLMGRASRLFLAQNSWPCRASEAAMGFMVAMAAEDLTNEKLLYSLANRRPVLSSYLMLFEVALRRLLVTAALYIMIKSKMSL